MPHSHRIVLFTVLTLMAVAVVVLAAQPLLTIFGGFLFALVLRGISEAISRLTRIRYGVCLVALVLTLVGLTALAAVEVGPTLRDQMKDLLTRLPDAARDVVARLQHVAGAAAPPAVPAAGGPPPDPKAIAGGAAALIGATAEILGALIVVFFVGVYGAARPGDYVGAVLAVTPKSYKQVVDVILGEVSANVTRWLLGRLVAMMFVGVTCAVAFTLLHVPLALVLALFAGLMTFIEYAGAILSAIPPVLLAFTKNPTAALAVLVVFFVLHVIEGYVLTPLLAKASVKLPPAVTLAVQVVFAALVGVLGLTFSTPLLAVAVVAVQTYRREMRGQE